MTFRLTAVFAALFTLSNLAFAEAAPPADTGDPVDLQWGAKIPLRDGVKLNATVYRP